MRRPVGFVALLTAFGCSSRGHGNGTPTPTPTPTPPPAYLGTDFLAVDLDNLDPTVATSFGLEIVNPDPAQSAQVTVASSTSGSVVNVTVPSGATAVSIPHRSVRGTGVSPSALRVTSTLPVAALQINPLGDVADGSVDMSLLLPTALVGTNYMTLFWPPKFGATPLPGFLVIAAGADATSVTITPSANIDGGGTVPPTAAGTPLVLSLNAFDVVNLEQAGDLSGSVITSTKPVSVFGGSQCGWVDAGALGCSHLEEEMLPLPLTGASYALVRSPPIPGGPTVDLWRLVGVVDGTTLTFDPAQAGAPVSLNRGQTVEFTSPDNFTLQASQPVVVGHFLEGATGATSPTGDSSFAIAPATAMWASEQRIDTPVGFASNTVTIIAPTGASVLLDAAAVTGFTPIGGSGLYQFKQATVSSGAHSVSSDLPVGVEVSGYDDYAAYATFGGLDLP